MDFCDGAEAESGGVPTAAAAGSRRTSGGVTLVGGGSGGGGNGRGGRRRSSGGSRGDRTRQRRESTALCREGRQMLSCATLVRALSLSLCRPAAKA